MPGPIRDSNGASGGSEAYQQLESMMLRQMLQASGAFRASQTPGASLHMDLFVETLADAVAKAGGMGIAHALEQQIGGKTTGGAAPTAASFAPTTGSVHGATGDPDDANAANSAAPLGEDPDAGSIDDLQPAGAPHVTSGFGQRIHPLTGRSQAHTGVDLRAPEGGAIRAAAAGVVREAGPRGGYGNAVEIDHGDGTTTLYAHASSLAVKPGQHVERGELVGQVGHTGQATGPHLHFELRRAGHPIDPSALAATSLAPAVATAAPASTPAAVGRALNRYRDRVEDFQGGTLSGAAGVKP